MQKRYQYCCKSCWHTWKSPNKYSICPKCKKTDLSIEEEIVF